MRECNTDYREKNSIIGFKKETLNEDTHFLKFYSNDYLSAMLNLENCNKHVNKDLHYQNRFTILNNIQKPQPQ